MAYRTTTTNHWADQWAVAAEDCCAKMLETMPPLRGSSTDLKPRCIVVLKNHLART